MPQSRKSIAILFGLLCFFSAWLVLLFQIRITADVAWLTQAAEHFLHGDRMLDYYFETNPPMSILIYVPVAFLKTLGLASWNAVNIFTLFLTVASVSMSAYFLRFWPLPKEIKILFLFGFAFVITFLSSFDYGQRDHMIAIMLLPFVLAQLSVTQAHPVNKAVRLFVFVFTSPFILIKPHYGLIPVVLMCHRAWKNRNLRVVLDSDFLILTMATLAYALVVITFFPEFLTVILPASVDLYAKEFSTISTLVNFLIALGFSFLAIFIASSIKQDAKTRYFLLLFALFSALALIPYLVQYKGFRYHLIPFLSLILPVTICSIYGVLSCVKKHQRLKRIFFFDMGLLLVAGIIFVFRGTLTFNHDFLQNDVIAQKIAETPEGSSFYIEYNTTGYTIHISEYMNREYASRFPAPWLFPNAYNDKATWNKYLDLNKKYIFEDFKRYQPELIFLVKNENYLSILSAYKDTPEFKTFFSNYEYVGEFADQQYSIMINNFGNDDQIRFAMYALKK